MIFGFGGPVTNNRFNDSLIGVATETSPPSSAASYGQLYCASAQRISLDVANSWVAIPFDTFGPSYHMTGSIVSPAAITIQEAGVYQMNVSLYFSSEDSPEATFTQTTYTLGTSINGNTTAANAAVYAGEVGYFSLHYTFLVTLAANDSIAFYMQPSATGGDIIFDNVVTIVNASASLVQIAQ